MTAYAVGILTDVSMNTDIVNYLAGIDATLQPYSGTFIIHGDQQDLREGQHVGDLIAISFPNLEQARGWYESAAYQAIIGLRTRNSTGTVFLIDGVDPDHRGTDILPPELHQDDGHWQPPLAGSGVPGTAPVRHSRVAYPLPSR
jgi:uncharacterized protein (DUF1330 family)